MKNFYFFLDFAIKTFNTHWLGGSVGSRTLGELDDFLTAHHELTIYINYQL